MPNIIKAVLIILWIQIILCVLLIAAAHVTLAYKAERGFWRGFQDSLAAKGGASSLAEYGPFNAGRISGAALILFTLQIVSVWSIKTRRLWPVVACTSLLILAALGQQSFPLFSIIVLVLVCRASARNWLKREVTPPPSTR